MACATRERERVKGDGFATLVRVLSTGYSSQSPDVWRSPTWDVCVFGVEQPWTTLAKCSCHVNGFTFMPAPNASSTKGPSKGQGKCNHTLVKSAVVLLWVHRVAKGCVVWTDMRSIGVVSP